MKRVRQKTAAHCGPATLEMLVSFVGIDLDQDRLVEAAGIATRIGQYGMTVAEMRKALEQLAPELIFWFKESASLIDLTEIIRDFGFPVGVEWQGVFYEDADEDNGHYGVVTGFDPVNQIIFLADPYKRFAGVDRQFHLEEFDRRWWDENEIHDPATGRIRIVREERMLFVVTPGDSLWPKSLGLTGTSF